MGEGKEKEFMIRNSFYFYNITEHGSMNLLPICKFEPEYFLFFLFLCSPMGEWMYVCGE